MFARRGYLFGVGDNFLYIIVVCLFLLGLMEFMFFVYIVLLFKIVIVFMVF